MNVLVFKTSVESKDHIANLAPMLDSLAGQGAWNFDLTDCDRILRRFSDEVNPETTIDLITALVLIAMNRKMNEVSLNKTIY